MSQMSATTPVAVPAPTGTAQAPGSLDAALDARPAPVTDATQGSQTQQTTQAPAGQGEPAKTTPNEPEFKVKLPDGVAETPEHADFVKLSKEIGLKSEQAQKLVDHIQAQAKSFTDSRKQELDQLYQAMDREVVKDPEIGGAKLEESKRLMAEALSNPKIATPALKERLEKLGLVRDVEFVRLFARLGRIEAPDNTAGTNRIAASGPPGKPGQANVKFYPNSPQLKPSGG